MSRRTVGGEALDFMAHGSSAFLALLSAHLLGVYWTWPGALLIGWAFGFVREVTEWQDGGNHPFTRWGILDQLGWFTGAFAFCLLVVR